GQRLAVATRLGQRLGARQRHLRALAHRAAVDHPERRHVDAEAARQPLERLGGGTRPPALDLADVLLREAPARERGLAHAGPDPERPNPLAELARHREVIIVAVASQIYLTNLDKGVTVDAPADGDPKAGGAAA